MRVTVRMHAMPDHMPRASWDADKAAPPNGILWQTAPYNRGIDALKHSDDCQKASARV